MRTCDEIMNKLNPYSIYKVKESDSLYGNDDPLFKG